MTLNRYKHRREVETKLYVFVDTKDLLSNQYVKEKKIFMKK